MNWQEVVFKSIIMILLALITGVVVPWVKAKMGKENLEKILAWAKIGVEAAEMLFPMPGSGAEKKKYVVDFLCHILAELNIRISEDEINNIIESAVKELHLKEEVAE